MKQDSTVAYNFYNKVVSHLQLLSIKKENIITFFSSPYRILLIILFSILYLPHVFILVDDINLISAYEEDAGSIISAIEALFQRPYNMNAGYHSSRYGWTYFSINFFLLIPAYIVRELKLVQGPFLFYLTIRFILFIIGLASLLAFFEVAKRALKQDLLSFIAALLYIISPVTFRFFYFIHPETTGLLFLFLGVLCLFRFNEGQVSDYRWYTLGLVCLVLSALSKQIFFFTSLPVLFLFLNFYCLHKKRKVFVFIRSKQFIKAFLSTTALSLFILFLIHPYAFFQPKILIDAQVGTIHRHSLSQTTLSINEAIERWKEVIIGVPIIFVSVLFCPVTLVVAFLQHNDKTRKMLYIVNLLGATFVLILILVTSRLIIYRGYLLPIYPFFILNVMITILYVIRKSQMRYFKQMVTILLSIFLFFNLVNDISISIPIGYSRFMYKNTVTYTVYKYIEENIPSGSKIAHDNFVAPPKNKGFDTCHYWRGCGTDYIEEFQPDYVIFNEDFTFNDMKYPETLRLSKYIEDHHFILMETIEGLTYTSPLAISVWVKGK